MANLPQIFANPDVASARAPLVPAAAFGGITLGESLQRAAGAVEHIAQTQQMLDVQNALDKRDEIYQQRMLEMRTNPQKFANMDAAQFTKAWTDQQKADDQSILKDMSFFSRGHASVLFARAARHQFDMQFNEYRKLWMDAGQARFIKSEDDFIQNIARAPNDQARQFHEEGLNALYKAASASGLFTQKQMADREIQKESRIEATQANMTMQEPGGPEKVMENIHNGVYSHVDPMLLSNIEGNAVRQSRLNEQRALTMQRAKQDGNFRVLQSLVQRGDLTQDEIKDWAHTNDIRPEHAKELNNGLVFPLYQSQPGAVDRIMGDHGERQLSIQSNNQAISQLRQLPPATPGRTNALNRLENSNYFLSRPRASEKTAEIEEAVKAFDLTPYGTGARTIFRRFHLPGEGVDPKYTEAKERLQLNMMRGMPKKQALEEAVKEVQPKKRGAGRSIGDRIHEDLGE